MWSGSAEEREREKGQKSAARAALEIGELGRGVLTGGEEAVDDLGEAHSGEVGGDGDGGGWRTQWGRQLGDEAHAHLARGVGVHGCGCGGGGREEGEDARRWRGGGGKGWRREGFGSSNRC